MHPRRSLALSCFQWAELSSVPEGLALESLPCWQREGAELSSAGSCERGVREEADAPQGGRGLRSALSAAWEGTRLGSPTVGLLRVGDDFIKVSVGFCIALSRG